MVAWQLRVIAQASALAVVLVAGSALAAPERPSVASEASSRPAAAPRSPGLTGAPDAPPTNEPRVERRVAEDDQVRVEELRVRGETRQITVQPKLPGARPYEIVPATGALDPSQRGRRPPGTSQWRVLNF